MRDTRDGGMHACLYLSACLVFAFTRLKNAIIIIIIIIMTIIMITPLMHANEQE